MLKSFPSVIYNSPFTDEPIIAEYDNDFLILKKSSGEVYKFKVCDQEQTVKVTPLRSLSNLEEKHILITVLDALFGHNLDLHRIDIDKALSLSRTEFYQMPFAWLRSQNNSKAQLKFTDGVHYRRYIPEIEKTLSFRQIEIEKDLETFHEWQNQPRVYDLWDLNKSIDELRQYLQKTLQDPHTIPMILSFDDEPVGYFEVYWAADDRIAPYYDVESYDRGFHFLIGNKKHLGSAKTRAAVSSVMHMIFLDEALTQRIVAEPRSDNKKVLKYVELVPGWKFIKEFDFPHKRAALLMASRSDFFNGGAL